MKKLIIGILLVMMSLGIAYAEVKTFPSGTSLRVTLDPSTDPRATGHNLYYSSGVKSAPIDMKTQVEVLIAAGTLTEGVEYELTATAYGVINGQPAESDPSEAIYVKILPPATIGDGTMVPSYTEDFQGLVSGVAPPDWISTKAANSMEEDNSLFKVIDLAGNYALGTTSTLTNIHSHATTCYVEALTVFEYTGKMMITDPNGAIGVTFLSRYPFSDTYYRLRRNQWQQSFHLAPHPHATAKNFGVLDSGVNPVAGQWYSYKVRVQDTGTKTEILAKIWPSASIEPANWQIDAYDDTASRLTSGTIGVWSDGPGKKYWDDLATSIPASQALCSPAIVDVKGY
jgi:hypothetical protein